MMDTANATVTETPAAQSAAVVVEVKPQAAVVASPEQLAKIAGVQDEIKEMRQALRDKEAELATLEREAGITRVSKIKSAVISTAHRSAGTIVSVGATIKQGSFKAVAKASAAFKSKDKSDTPPADPEAGSSKSGESSPAAISFSTKLRAARDGFTASFKRATTKSPTANQEDQEDTPAATVAAEAADGEPSGAAAPSINEPTNA